MRYEISPHATPVQKGPQLHSSSVIDQISNIYPTTSPCFSIDESVLSGAQRVHIVGNC